MRNLVMAGGFAAVVLGLSGTRSFAQTSPTGTPVPTVNVPTPTPLITPDPTPAPTGAPTPAITHIPTAYPTEPIRISPTDIAAPVPTHLPEATRTPVEFVEASPTAEPVQEEFPAVTVTQEPEPAAIGGEAMKATPTPPVAAPQTPGNLPESRLSVEEPLGTEPDSAEEKIFSRLVVPPLAFLGRTDRRQFYRQESLKPETSIGLFAAGAGLVIAGWLLRLPRYNTAQTGRLPWFRPAGGAAVK